MKKVKIYVMGLIILGLIATSVLATTKSDELRASLSSSVNKLEAGQETVVTLKFDQYNKIKKGLYAFKATLEYDKTIFEEVASLNFVPQNDWEELEYNPATGEVVAIKKAGSKIEENIIQINLQVKDEVEPAKTNIILKDITTSEGKQDITIEDAKAEIDIIKEQTEKPEDPAPITSSKYRIEDGYILRILPQTSVAEFKGNVDAEEDMVLLDEKGNELKQDSIIKTGTKLTVGEHSPYTLIVIGDIDKDGKITTNDLARLKLHLIEYKLLTGMELKAADVDDDNKITINDLGQIKLILIDLLKLK